VTLADVARLAGVSPITVSRAIRGERARGERAVDAELVQRVKAAAQKLGYVPDPAARALASRRGSHVAVLIPMLSNNLFVDVLEAVQQTLRPLGYQSLIGITHYDAAEEEQLLREQLQHRPAGVLPTGLDRSESTRALLRASGVPCVHMMETTQEPGVYSVGLQRGPFAGRRGGGDGGAPAGAGLPAHRLCRRPAGPAHAAAAAGLASAHAGRRAARSDAGVAEPGAFFAGGGRPHVRADPRPDTAGGCDLLLQRRPGAGRPAGGQGALLAAARLGVRVPQRLAVAGFNDLTGNDQMHPTLTTVRTPRAQMGAAAARMLIELIRGETPAPASIDLGFELVVRGST